MSFEYFVFFSQFNQMVLVTYTVKHMSHMLGVAGLVVVPARTGELILGHRVFLSEGALLVVFGSDDPTLITTAALRIRDRSGVGATENGRVRRGHRQLGLRVVPPWCVRHLP